MAFFFETFVNIKPNGIAICHANTIVISKKWPISMTKLATKRIFPNTFEIKTKYH